MFHVTTGWLTNLLAKIVVYLIININAFNFLLNIVDFYHIAIVNLLEKLCKTVVNHSFFGKNTAYCFSTL